MICKMQGLGEKGQVYDEAERKQLDVIHINFFKTEDQIVKKLIKVKKNILPYRLFILLRGQLIDNYWKKKDIKQKG